jgi:hypothetical protein
MVVQQEASSKQDTVQRGTAQVDRTGGIRDLRPCAPALYIGIIAFLTKLYGRLS